MNLPPRPPLEVSVEDAFQQACSQTPLIDIRDAAERSAGAPAGTLVLSPGELMTRCLEDAPFAGRGGYVLCAEGVRSLKQVRELHRGGLTQFRSVRGGMLAWARAGLPIVLPDDLNREQLERYARHLVMPQVGLDGQKKLMSARVLLAGLGGLNSPAALYLAAAGVGVIGLVDDDKVERSNLQRQVLHGETSIGHDKVDSAARRLQDMNPDTETIRVDQRITPGNALEIVRGWDVVIDGTDNFPARYALNQACVKQGIPLVYGAVMRFQGQVSVFHPQAAPDLPCFRCLMPREPAPGEAPSCAQAGVLGIVPGIVGTLQATEALKLLLGAGQPLLGRLLMVDALTMEFRTMRIPRRADCPDCAVASE